MEEYLLPYNEQSIEQKCEMFAVKNRMINIPYNFSSNSEVKCVCGNLENMVHLYECDLFNKEKQPEIPYVKIYNGNLKEQIEVFNKFTENMDTRKELMETSTPCDRIDPLYFSKG